MPAVLLFLTRNAPHTALSVNICKIYYPSSPLLQNEQRWLTVDEGKPPNGLHIMALFFFFFHLSVPQKEGGKIFFLTGWMPQGFIRRWDFSGLSFHLSQCVAPTTSPGQGLNGWKENEGVRNHLESEISQLWWREGKDGWRRREVKSHCFHQGLAKKPLRAFWRKKLEKYVLRQCGKGVFLSLSSN